jgi:hypothetical protein
MSLFRDDRKPVAMASCGAGPLAKVGAYLVRNGIDPVTKSHCQFLSQALFDVDLIIC